VGAFIDGSLIMPTHVLLLNFTDQGIKSVKQTVERSKGFREVVNKHGGSVKSLHWTQGAYDVVATIDTPDEESAMALLLTIGSLGNLRSQSLRAFSADEMEQIIGKMK
jgi:uncharacterized protein with GYD domain